jgi:hypothetical protein
VKAESQGIIEVIRKLQNKIENKRIFIYRKGGFIATRAYSADLGKKILAKFSDEYFTLTFSLVFIRIF